MDRHFDQDLNFLATEEDPVTKKVSFENLIFFTVYSFLVITIMFGFSFIDGETTTFKCQAEGYWCSYFKLSW